MTKNIVKAKLLLIDMENINMWIQFTTSQANKDLQRYGEWHCDYALQISQFQADYEKTRGELDKLMSFF